PSIYFIFLQPVVVGILQRLLLKMSLPLEENKKIKSHFPLIPLALLSLPKGLLIKSPKTHHILELLHVELPHRSDHAPSHAIQSVLLNSQQIVVQSLPAPLIAYPRETLVSQTYRKNASIAFPFGPAHVE